MPYLEGGPRWTLSGDIYYLYQVVTMTAQGPFSDSPDGAWKAWREL